MHNSCNDCLKYFKDQKELLIHLALNPEHDLIGMLMSRNYKCPVCGEKQFDEDELKDHMEEEHSNKGSSDDEDDEEEKEDEDDSLNINIGGNNDDNDSFGGFGGGSDSGGGASSDW